MDRRPRVCIAIVGEVFKHQACRVPPVHPIATDCAPPESLPSQLDLKESAKICVICGPKLSW